MSKPVRLQLSRRKGFDLQAHSLAVNGLAAVNVARPSLFGNPFTAKDAEEASYRDGNKMAAWAFGEWMRGAADFADHEPGRRSIILNILPQLRGKNVACWCKGEHCHADVLLRLAADL